MLNLRNKYAPDVLDCIANLSSDEVFTSPKLANQMLDMVPQELFTNPRTKFLDPCCKSGVFLREIVKRLDKGLEDIIPDRQQRIDHILHKQVFGIAITELTAQLSRRTVYCSKYACAMQSGDVWISDENDDEHGIHETHSYSISEFTADDVNDFCINPIQGNIRFDKSMKHEFDKNGVCKICGVNKQVFDEHSHAYELIHLTSKRLEALKNMQWDLIISNPPYQLSVGGGNGANAIPVYHKFIEQSQKLQPRYLTMIVPSKWFNGGRGLDAFREQMLNDNRISEIHDFRNSKECFSGVEIQGGVNYFLWEKDKKDPCCKFYEHNCDKSTLMVRPLKNAFSNGVIRYNSAMEIVNKVQALQEPSFSSLVSSLTPFGILSNFKDYSSDGTGGKVAYIKRKEKSDPENIFVDPKYITKHKKWVDKYKVYFSLNYGAGMSGDGPYQVTPQAFVGATNSCCSQSYLVVGNVDSEAIAQNIVSYWNTKFFRFLVMLCIAGQTFSPNTFSLVPVQDFSKAWTDKELYAKYKLTTEEQDLIESMIKAIGDNDENQSN